MTQADCAAQTDRLIANAKKDDYQAKDEIVVMFTPLIKSIVKRFLMRGLEYDDLFQIGCIGLLKAVRRFDVHQGVQFTTYAVPCIAGEIKDVLRDTGSVKVSRSIKMTAYKIRQIQQELWQQGNFNPTLSEIALRTGISVEEASAAMSYSYPVASLQDLPDKKTVCALQNGENQPLDRLFLHELLGKLPIRERQLIVLRFLKEKTQQEIAGIMHVSQVQISRMEKKILKKLHAYAL